MVLLVLIHDSNNQTVSNAEVLMDENLEQWAEDLRMAFYSHEFCHLFSNFWFHLLVVFFLRISLEPNVTSLMRTIILHLLVSTFQHLQQHSCPGSTQLCHQTQFLPNAPHILLPLEHLLRLPARCFHHHWFPNLINIFKNVFKGGYKAIIITLTFISTFEVLVPVIQQSGLPAKS